LSCRIEVVSGSDEKRVFLSKTERTVSASDVFDGPATALELDRRIGDFIARGESDDVSFDRLALDLFAYQFSANAAYRRYCERRGGTPADVRRWSDVPAIPASAFADLRLACFPPERAVLTFVSSGTTRGRPSRHELESAGLYDASLLAHFRACVLPDVESIRIFALAPSFASAPSSSLAYMISKISATFGTRDDAFFIADDTLDFESTAAALRRCDAPALIIGTAFGFVHFFDYCRQRGLRFALPVGSRVIETGGFKGRSRVVSGDKLYGWFGSLLGVPRAMCASEYGMCELGSQWYDANLMDHLADEPIRLGVKVGPPWARTLVVDPVTTQPVPKGQSGLLQIFDLSNRGSVAAVLTGDLAREIDGGFELLGRAPGEPPKGCSIAIDAVLAGHGD
jgi:Acyl-protein synthetase, LuxE